MNKFTTFMLWGTLVVTTFILSGCAVSSLWIKAPRTVGIDANSVVAEGEAATLLARQLADNIKTKEGMLADLFKRNGELFAGLIITLVGGLIFWGVTRSTWGWVIPSACIGGISCMLFFVNYAKWIPIGILAIVLGVLIWKAVEYQKERNKAGKEKDRVQVERDLLVIDKNTKEKTV